MDIAIVIELNILSDWIMQDEKVRTNLRERLYALEELKLNYSILCLRNYVESTY